MQLIDYEMAPGEGFIVLVKSPHQTEKVITKRKKLKKMSREEHNKMAIIDNLVWEIAKILIPNSFIEPKKVAEAKSNLIKSLTE